MSRRIGVIGVPTSAGAFAPGQERAPQALLWSRLHELGAGAPLAQHVRDRERTGGRGRRVGRDLVRRVSDGEYGRVTHD